MRPLLNCLRRPPLPPPGKPLPFFYLAFLSTDDTAAFAALMRRVYNDALGQGYSYFAVGVHEDDPRAAVLADYARTRFAGRVFAVTMDHPPRLDGRVPYIEAALL